MSDAPRRIQLSRAKGWRMPPDGMKIDRSTEWGNHFRIVGPVKVGTDMVEWWIETDAYIWRFETKAEAQVASVKLYRTWINLPAQALLRDRIRLRFRRARPACWCHLHEPCHGDVISEIANAD